MVGRRSRRCGIARARGAGLRYFTFNFNSRVHRPRARRWAMRRCAGCPPDPLFASGVSAIAGSWIADPAALVRAITTGAPWGSSVIKSLLTPEGYPGWATLLRRASGG